MPPITRKRKRETERAAFNCLMIENMGNFKVLPAEIMEIVLSSLDAPSLSSLSCTCKKLHEYTQKSWKTLCDRLALDYTPTPLCLASRSAIPVVYQYDIALHKCTSDVSKWRIMAIRQWLYCHWKCVVCYRSCTRRSDPHRDILLCESCHPVFYKRKSSAKEQFGLTERDLHLIVSNGYEYLITDLIFLARTKYGGKDGLDQRLREKRRLKLKREAEKECNLVKRESEVVHALRRYGSSYCEVQLVDARFMPYVSIPSTYRRCSSQTAEDAAKWLISMKDRYEGRYKALMEQILLLSSKCKGCSNLLCISLHTLSACCHITNEEAMKTFAFIKDNFTSDIQLYMKNGLLGEAQNGPADCENWAANELFERAERKQNLKKALLDLATEWPPIVEEGVKNPLQCSMAEDYVQKGILMLQHQTGKCRLKKANDIARVILAAARGWQSRSVELTTLLGAKGFHPPFEALKPECQSLLEDYIDHMVIVRNGNMVACSATEVVNEIADLQGVREGNSPDTSVKSEPLVFKQQIPGEEFTLAVGRRQALKKKYSDCGIVEDSVRAKTCSETYSKTGSINSLFGYKLTTPEAIAEIVKLRTTLFGDEEECEERLPVEKCFKTTSELSL